MYWIELGEVWQSKIKPWLKLPLRKHYKLFLFVVALLGSVIVVVSEKVIGLSLSSADKLSDVIYFVTAVILFWYTYETYNLKKIQSKQLREIRKQTDFDMKPYLRLRYEQDTSSQEVFEIINEGKGLAKDVRFERFNLTLGDDEISFSINSRALISPKMLDVIVYIDELYEGMNVVRGVR